MDFKTYKLIVFISQQEMIAYSFGNFLLQKADDSKTFVIASFPFI